MTEPRSTAEAAPLSDSIIPLKTSVSNLGLSTMTRADHEAQVNAGVSAHSPLRSLLALILLIIVAAVCFSLGLWQTGRAAERDALRQAIEQGRGQTPLMLSSASPATALTPWRPASAQGQWLSQYSVLLENRNLDGRPGYWVATPLLLDPDPHSDSGGTASPENPTAILVLRGWLPRNLNDGTILPVIPDETGTLRISGELHTHVPRIFELWQWAGGQAVQLPAALPQADGAVPEVQNLALTDYARATGLRLLPGVLAQTQDAIQLPQGHALPSQQLERDWPGPSLDSDQNRGYALQWFSFSAIAVIAALFIGRALMRRRFSTASRKQ